MIKVKVKFGVGTAYVNSRVEDEVEIEVYPEDDMSEDEIESLIDSEIEDRYDDWMWGKIETWQKEISREIVEDEE